MTSSLLQEYQKSTNAMEAAAEEANYFQLRIYAEEGNLNHNYQGRVHAERLYEVNKQRCAYLQLALTLQAANGQQDVLTTARSWMTTLRRWLRV